MRALFVIAVALTAAPSYPQAPHEKLAFEVASIKANKSDAAQSLTTTLITFIATNFELRNLITVAYRIQASRLIGGPAWLSSKGERAPKYKTIAHINGIS